MRMANRDRVHTTKLPDLVPSLLVHEGYTVPQDVALSCR